MNEILPKNILMVGPTGIGFLSNLNQKEKLKLVED
jgi:ATP-dependent protease HslVU (ClpYQ) ATPase subunit